MGKSGQDAGDSVFVACGLTATRVAREDAPIGGRCGGVERPCGVAMDTSGGCTKRQGQTHHAGAAKPGPERPPRFLGTQG